MLIILFRETVEIDSCEQGTGVADPLSGAYAPRTAIAAR